MLFFLFGLRYHSIIRDGRRHKQRSGQHTLVLQKIYKKHIFSYLNIFTVKELVDVAAQSKYRDFFCDSILFCGHCRLLFLLLFAKIAPLPLSFSALDLSCCLCLCIPQHCSSNKGMPPTPRQILHQATIGHYIQVHPLSNCFFTGILWHTPV
jgi:hypothetical protein